MRVYFEKQYTVTVIRHAGKWVNLVGTSCLRYTFMLVIPTKMALAITSFAPWNIASSLCSNMRRCIGWRNAWRRKHVKVFSASPVRFTEEGPSCILSMTRQICRQREKTLYMQHLNSMCKKAIYRKLVQFWQPPVNLGVLWLRYRPKLAYWSVKLDMLLRTHRFFKKILSTYTHIYIYISYT